MIRETDSNHGATTEQALRAELANVDLSNKERDACSHLIDRLFPSAVEWYREAHLKHAALSEVVNAIFEHTNGEVPAAQVARRGKVKGPPCPGIFVSEHYARLHDVRQELADAFGVPLLDSREPSTPVIVLLCPGA
eukprot:4258235-Prymnesium_polylepis.1